MYLKNELFEGILSKDEFQRMNYKNEFCTDNLVLISIHDPDREQFPDLILQDYKDYLQIAFWDIETSKDNQEPITPEQGTILKEFIQRNKDSRFLIHCSAGISRSAGVGLAVECIVNCNGNKYEFSTSNSTIKEHKRYSPNYKVYDTVIDSITGYK